MRDVKFWVWRPLDWQRGLYKTDITRCRYSVHDTYGVGFHQCSRKAKEEIDGYGFCKFHAARVRKALE